MTDLEKRKFINADFRRRVVVPTGTMPDNLDEVNEWWKRALENSENFFKRYESNSMDAYVTEIWLDWIDDNEDKFRRLLNVPNRQGKS